MSLSERGLQVLRAIVQDYVASHEPVGSKAIVERHQFGVSAATIRNEMAVLEEEELIAAPHTSSGRVPTDKGYRVFVDHLAQLRPLSAAQRAAIVTFLDQSEDLDELLAASVRTLSQLTGQLAVVQYPSFSAGHISHLDFVALSSQRVSVIVVTDTGRVAQGLLRLNDSLALGEHPESLRSERERIRNLIMGESVQSAVAVIENALLDAAPNSLFSSLLTQLQEQFAHFQSEKVIVSGAANLLRSHNDLSQDISPLLAAVEEQATLLRLMGEMVADGQRLAVRIGRENEAYGLAQASVIASEYEQGKSVARLGVIGPMRMDYPAHISAVRAVAKYLSHSLDSERMS